MSKTKNISAVLIRGPVLSVLADNAPTARTVQLHEPPAVNIAGGETRLKRSFACHQCEHVVSVREGIIRRQRQAANITFRRGIGAAYAFLATARAFVFAFRLFRVNNGLARIGFVFNVLRGHSAASLILALAIAASNNSHLHAAWPTGKTIRLNGFSEFDEPSFWNNGCSQYVAALLLKSIDITVDKELYDKIGKSINPKQKGVHPEALEEFLDDYFLCERRPGNERIETIQAHLKLGNPLVATVETPVTKSLHSILIVGYVQTASGEITDYVLQDNGLFRGTYSHADFLKLWRCPSHGTLQNRCILVSPKGEIRPEDTGADLDDILLQFAPPDELRLPLVRALSPSTLVEKIRVKKEAIRNKLRSFKKALNKEATTTLNKADPIFHPSLKKIAPRLQEIRTELDNLAKSQEKLSAYKLSKINPFKVHPIVPLRIQEYGLLKEGIHLQHKLPYYDPEGPDQVELGVAEELGRGMYLPTFHDGSSAVHAPYYGRNDDLVMGENDFLRHLKELESHGPEPDQDGVFIAPYPSFHEEIDDLEKRLGHVYSSQQRDLIKRRLAWLTAQREELYQTDAEAFDQGTAEQVWRVVNGITATANTWLIYAYEHLKTNALEHAVSFGLGLLIPISLIAIRRWRDPLD